MKKKLSLLSLFVLIFAFIFLYPNSYIQTPIHAQNSDDLSQQIQNKQAEIAKLEAQLNEARNTEKTLKSQLNLIDGQAKVTTLKIEETILKIEKLDREINDLSKRIDRISGSLDVL